MTAPLVASLCTPAFAHRNGGNLGVGSDSRWSANFTCLQHQSELLNQPLPFSGTAPATRRFLTGLIGLMLLGPEFRFNVELLASGGISEESGCIQGDLVLRGIHPSLLDELELWQVVRAVRQRGVECIDGDVRWEIAAPQPVTSSMNGIWLHPSDFRARSDAPWPQLRLKELKARLQRAGIEFNSRSTSSQALEQTFLVDIPSVPLALLLRRELDFLKALLFDLHSSWPLIEQLETDLVGWNSERLDRLAPQQAVRLLRIAWGRSDLVFELLSALKSFSANPPIENIRGIVSASEEMTEILGFARLKGHDPILFDLRVEGQVTEEYLLRLLRVLLLSRTRLGSVDSVSFAVPSATR